jgi:beta-N-acetylhexosaminidase
VLVTRRPGAAGVLAALTLLGGPNCAAKVRLRAAPIVPVPRSSVKLLGQRIMVGLTGTSADPALLDQVRAGRVGEVILFAANIVDRPQVTALTAALQRAARQGGNPPLLIAIDQEGGQVKRFPNGPPFRSPPEMAQSGSTTLAFRQGQMTGGFLRQRGINMDLAPVLDVPTTPNAFIWQQGRAFSFSASTVAAFGTAFASGLQSAGIAATGKHFPGVGSAPIDTDNQLQELRPSKSQLAGALAPYRAAIPKRIDAIMLATAGFPGYDPSGTPAALSRTMIHGLLRGRLNFAGVTITDALGTPTGHDETTAGVLAAAAGADILLFTDSAPGELGALQAALGRGQISRADAAASYTRIVELKRAVAHG